MTKIRLHQTGTAPVEIAQPSVGDTILDSNSTNKEGYAQYEGLSTTAQAARLNAAASQLGLQSGTSSSRSSSWSTDINTTFTVTFGGYSVTNGDGTTTTVNGDNHMRVFF